MNKLTESLRDPSPQKKKKEKKKRARLGIIRAGRFPGLKIVTSEFPEFQESQKRCLDEGCLLLGSMVTILPKVGLIWVLQNQIFEGSLQKGYVVLEDETEVKSRLFGAGKGFMWVWVGVSEGREQVQLICAPQTRVPSKVSSVLSESPGSLGVGGGGPSGLRLQVSERRGPVGFLQAPQTQVSGPGRVFVTLGPIRARADAEGGPGWGCGRPR